MPGLEFEKNVQQRLDELKLRPSKAVWKNVEENIRQEKRRRRMVLWLPLLFLLLGGTGYFLINKNGFVSAETAVKTKQAKEKNNSTISPLSKDLQKEETQKEKNQELTPKDLNGELVAKVPKNQNANSKTRQSQKSDNKTLDKTDATFTSDKDQVQSLIKGQENVDNDQNDIQRIGNDEVLIGYAKVNPSLIKVSSPKVDISIPENYSAKIQTPEVDLNAISALKKKEKFRSAKWQWGLDFSVGSSSANSEFSSFKSAQMDALANTGPLPRYSGTSTSSLDPGLYWSAGGFVLRNFTNRFALSAGLQYSQYRTQLTTGTRGDSARLFYGSNYAVVDNQNDKANEHIYRYHFIELPMTAHFKLNKSNSFPVFGNVGISIGWLLGTNSMNYGGSTVFSQVSGQYNETQFGLRGGFTFGALNKTKHPLRIGPSLRYNLSGLTESASSNNHLLAFGLDVRVLLKK